MGWGEGLLSFCDGRGDREVRCNGRGQARSPTKSGWDNADAKPTERSLIGKGGGAERWGSAW